MVEKLYFVIYKPTKKSLKLELLNELVCSSVITLATFVLLVKCIFFENMNQYISSYNELSGQTDNCLKFSEVFPLPKVFQGTGFC